MVAETDLLTVAEAARLLRVSRVTMRRWLKQGRLPSYRVGPRSVRVRREDLEKVLTPAQQEEGATASGAGTPWVRRLTEEEKRRALEAVEASRALIADMRTRRGGRPMAESWPMIREAREERSKQQL
ncbi:MAG: helix-turn-helix domain-containing protein [Dehalococcoidia bacterium]